MANLRFICSGPSVFAYTRLLSVLSRREFRYLAE
jgi:hypothetical protein